MRGTIQMRGVEPGLLAIRGRAVTGKAGGVAHHLLVLAELLHWLDLDFLFFLPDGSCFIRKRNTSCTNDSDAEGDEA
jgi:hypothetical protein